MMKIVTFSVLIAAIAIAGPARADDVSDAIGDGQRAYQAGDLAGAKQALDLASQLVAQRQADALGKLLPEAPAGWTAEAVDAGAGMASILGGGLVVKRAYGRDGKTVEVQLMANSPLLGQLAPLFSNLQMLGGMGKVFRQNGRAAVVSDDGEIQVMAGRTYVTLSGSAPEADKRAILDRLDLAAIEAFGK